MIMGSDLQGQLSILQRLQATATAPGLMLDLCNDLARCDLLVFRSEVAQSGAARRLVSKRPGLPVWSISRDGALCDALCEPPEPLEESEVRDLLDRLDTPEPDAQASVDAAIAVPAPVPARAPDDAGPLGLAIRERLLAAETVSALALEGQDLLLLDFRRLLLAVAPGADLQDQTPAQLLAQRFSQLTQHALPAAEYSTIFVDTPSTPLVPVLWQAALRMQESPELLAPLHEACALRLRRWPDFRVLAHRHDDFRLCSLLLRKACTVAQAAHGLGLDPGAVRAFFNAAWLTGYAHVESEGVVAPSLPTARPRGAGALLASMWRGVRGIKGS